MGISRYSPATAGAFRAQHNQELGSAGFEQVTCSVSRVEDVQAGLTSLLDFMKQVAQLCKAFAIWR